MRRYRIGAHSCGDGVTKYKLFVCLVGFLSWEVEKTRTYILFTVQSIHTPPQMSSINHTFVQQIQNLINWIDADAIHMDKESILDGVRERVLVMAQKFVAFLHCHNFSLMP